MSERMKSRISSKEGMKAKQILAFGILPDGISVQSNAQVFGNMSQEDRETFERLQDEMADFITHRMETLMSEDCGKCDCEGCNGCDDKEVPEEVKNALVGLLDHLKEVLTK